MSVLVTIAEARAHLQVTHSDDDTYLSMAINAATSAIIRYLDGYEVHFLDTSGAIDRSQVPQDIAWACLLLVGEFYRNREAEQDGQVEAAFGYGYLPRPVVSLLFDYKNHPVS